MDKERYLSELQMALRDAGKSKRYISACLSYASTLLNEGLPVIFDVKHLALLLGIDPFEFGELFYSIDGFGYHEMEIPKKSGGIRKISVPSVDLKYIQRWILDNILSKIHVSDYANGFVADRSIVTNAAAHIGAYCVINLDIKDFFPSISYEQVFYIFKYYGYTKEISYVLAKLCTHNGFLPQGSPASPYITNILCLKMDKRLGELAKKYEAVYTRYADDITFSGKKGILSMIPVAEKIIREEGFSVNAQKTRSALKHQRQEVTGLIINDGTLRIPKEYKRKFRQEIYYCKKYGVYDHQEKAGENYAFYREHLYGKAYFIHMVEPGLGEKLLAELDDIEWEY